MPPASCGLRLFLQAIALLERLRQEVASLTSSTYEELVAVSIDALEIDFHASSASGTDDRNADDHATKRTARELHQVVLGGTFFPEFRQPTRQSA